MDCELSRMFPEVSEGINGINLAGGRVPDSDSRATAPGLKAGPNHCSTEPGFDSITDTAPCRSLTKTIGSWSFWKAPTLPRAWQQGMMLRDAQRRQVMPSNISMIINVPLILWSCCPYSYWLCLPWQQKPPQPRAEKTLQRALGKWAPSVGASGKSLWTKIHKSANQLKLVLKFEKAQTFDLFQIIKIWRMCCAH